MRSLSFVSMASLNMPRIVSKLVNILLGGRERVFYFKPHSLTFCTQPLETQPVIPMANCCGCCGGGGGGGADKASRRSSSAPLLAMLFLASAVPIALLYSLERAALSAGSIQYRSRGWLRECAKWDAPRRRFLASTFLGGGLAQIPLDSSGGDGEGALLEERDFVSDGEVAGNASLGVAVDAARGRVLVAYADVWGFRFSAVGAYDIVTGDRLFLTRLGGPGDEQSFADDVAVDENGNAYITDAKANKLWKVDFNGELVSVIRSDVFVQRKEWYYNLIGLNGIVYHPNGYLLVIHTTSGSLFKVDTAREEVSMVKVRGSLLMGDGLELISPTKLVVAGTPSARMVESSDNWETATITARYVGPLHRTASSATVMDGMVYLNHLFGGGLTERTHIIAKAVFVPLGTK